MKRNVFVFLVAIALLSIAGCRKETNYAIKNDCGFVLYDVRGLCYDDGILVSENDCGDLNGFGGKSSVFKLNNGISDVKISFIVKNKQTGLFSSRMVTTTKYHVTVNADNVFVVNDLTTTINQ